jgi:prefoldin subunit 5
MTERNEQLDRIEEALQRLHRNMGELRQMIAAMKRQLDSVAGRELKE